MPALNTGSWYQILLRRRREVQSVPYPPIEWFRVTSDILNIHMTLSAENLREEFKTRFTVVNAARLLNMIMSVENTNIIPRTFLSIQSSSRYPSIVLSAESI